MLRKIIIGLGLFVALVPYLGFPSSWDTVFLTTSGLTIVALLLLAKKGRHGETRTENRAAPEDVVVTVADTPDDVDEDESPRALHVEHTEVEEHPSVHIERETIVDTEKVEETPDTETTIEKKMTVTRRRKKKNEFAADDSSGGGFGDTP